MSVLSADVHNELALLLDALQSSDNAVRSQAEEHLANNWTAAKPEILLMGLVEQIQGSNDPTVMRPFCRSVCTTLLTCSPLQTRSFAAVIFRRIASKARKLPDDTTTETFLALEQTQGYVIRQKLLEALGTEDTNPVRNKIGDAVAEVARQYSDASMLPEAIL